MIKIDWNRSWAEDDNVRLMDYETGADLGAPTEEQLDWSAGLDSHQGVFAIDSEGQPLREDEAGPKDRRVFVA
jgi:hypothetical protein